MEENSLYVAQHLTNMGIMTEYDLSVHRKKYI